MSTQLDFVLYDGLDETGSIEVSTTSSSGPWTKLTLTSPKCVSDALAEWQDLADAAHPGHGWSFSAFDDGYSNVEFGASSPWWVRLPPALQVLLGHADVFGAASGNVGSTATAQGFLVHDSELGVGNSFPLDKEEAELVEYRAARSSSYHYNRVVELQLDLFLSPALQAEYEESPLVSGHGAFRVMWDGNDLPFAEDNKAGALLVYPITTLESDDDGEESWVHTPLLVTMEDPS